MKCIVIYYSQTGNTSKIAHAIYAGMKQIVQDCNISVMKNTNPQELVKYDLIGLGSPWWGKLPPNFRSFIDQMDSLAGKHVFPFFTHGSLPAGCMHTTIPLLKQKGLNVIGFNDWYCNSIQQFIPYPHLTAGHPDKIDLDQAEEFGKKMADLSCKILSGNEVLPMTPTEAELDEIYGKPMPPGEDMLEAEKELQSQRKINMQKCTRCGLCVDNCPTESIDFSTSPPVFRDSCTRCWFCEQICPEGAIEINWDSFAKFHDGSIDFLIKGLEMAEAKGRFRRLVNLNEVGWHNYWYKISGHPRYKIENDQ